jgi:hypothetical protein
MISQTHFSRSLTIVDFFVILVPERPHANESFQPARRSDVHYIYCTQRIGEHLHSDEPQGCGGWLTAGRSGQCQ